MVARRQSAETASAVPIGGRIDDFLLAFWDALVGRWAWLRIAAIVVGLAWAVLASVAAQRAWKEDGAWSPRVFGLVLSTAAGVFVATSGLALWIVYART